MNLLYNAGIALYDAATAVASLRSRKIRDMLRGRKHTLATLADERRRVAPDGYDLWIHAASLGEFEQGRPLIERLRRERPGITILLTFYSPSGYNVRHDYPQVDTVAYLPGDSVGDVRAFLDAAAPRMAIFVKYEFWGNYLEQLHKRGVPTYIISSIFRPGQRFFKPGGEMWRRMLRSFSHLYVQDEPSRRLLARIGIDNVTVAGDTRFDRVTDILRTTADLPLIEQFCRGDAMVFIAGSSWEPDEEIYIPWLQANPQVRAIIAPHQFDEARLRRLVRRLGAGTCLLSDIAVSGRVPDGCRAIVVDSFGLLSSIYRYGDVAYIGGGFGAGIHNINEAAVYGIPVVFGPRHQKFKEAADLITLKGGFEISGRDTFESVMSRFVAEPAYRKTCGAAAGKYISNNLGATEIIYNDIFNKK